MKSEKWPFHIRASALKCFRHEYTTEVKFSGGFTTFRKKKGTSAAQWNIWEFLDRKNYKCLKKILLMFKYYEFKIHIENFFGLHKKRYGSSIFWTCAKNYSFPDLLMYICRLQTMKNEKALFRIWFWKNEVKPQKAFI